MLSELEEKICKVLRRRFSCVCSRRPPYCKDVAELFDMVLESYEEEVKKWLSN